MPAVDGLKERIGALIKAAPSQAKLAWLGGISGGTIINWRRGLGFRESDLREFCKGTGVALEWLKHGKGAEAEAIAAVKDEAKYVGYKSRPDSDPDASVTVKEEQRSPLRQLVDEIDAHGSDEAKKIVEDMLRAAKQRILDRKKDGGSPPKPL